MQNMESHKLHQMEKNNAQHLWLKVMVFINPIFASLPKHGCYGGRGDGGTCTIVHRKCGTGSSKEERLETQLSKDFEPLILTNDMDKAWEELVFGGSGGEAGGGK